GRCGESARRCRWSAGSWSWCACGRCPRPQVELVFVALVATELSTAVGQHPRQPDTVLVIERHHPVVEDLGRGDRRLTIIELGEGDLGIGVDEGLLVDPSHPLQCADIEGVLCSAVAWALALELAMASLSAVAFSSAAIWASV